ncbi:hypothetical protein BJ085DRAFT_19050 [Dimargaris cristalligena]|uniref:Uncharacterized protein n=1 Tax=Dimargaris cristalligena TaxID=215637 RepID=A0A4Q0A303_9FUNG|nr:hypothetical protein BJ085DRAFT_19050 [Dimargaris cristalligena]|eukprot:RKP39921.1 hypothetical protein BJ085DRAFT_19050 [Dimargaris cristalligena]
MSALAWPFAIVKMAQIIDNPWAVGLNRATKAGEVLADVLRRRAEGGGRDGKEEIEPQPQGNRPTILVGYSLGALTIFRCLQVLAQNPANEGLIDSVVLLGGPFQGNQRDSWAAVRRVVARRIVVGYSTNDWILAYLYRVQALSIHMIGLTGVDDAVANPDGRIENVDLSDIVAYHSDYSLKLTEILDRVNI